MTPKPCPKCRGPATEHPRLKGQYGCPNPKCKEVSILSLAEWNSLPRPSTESVSSSAEETPETDLNMWYHDASGHPDRSKREMSGYHVKADFARHLERHRNALLRFIREEIPHAEECELTREPSGATQCTCYLSRIPKP